MHKYIVHKNIEQDQVLLDSSVDLLLV